MSLIHSLHGEVIATCAGAEGVSLSRAQIHEEASVHCELLVCLGWAGGNVVQLQCVGEICGKPLKV